MDARATPLRRGGGSGMIKKIIQTYEQEIYMCDSCNQKIVQDGKNIELIKHVPDREGYAYHFHRTCLNEHLAKTFVPNP